MLIKLDYYSGNETMESMPTRRDRSRVQAYDIKGMFPKRGFLTRVYIVSTRKTLKQERHQWRPERREAKSGDTS